MLFETVHEPPIKFKMFRGKTVLYVLSGAQWRMKYIFDSISLEKKTFLLILLLESPCPLVRDKISAASYTHGSIVKDRGSRMYASYISNKCKGLTIDDIFTWPT